MRIFWKRYCDFSLKNQDKSECNKKVIHKKSTSGLMSQANAFLDESDNITKNWEGICSSKKVKPFIYQLFEGGWK